MLKLLVSLLSIVFCFTVLTSRAFCQDSPKEEAQNISLSAELRKHFEERPWVDLGPSPGNDQHESVMLSFTPSNKLGILERLMLSQTKIDGHQAEGNLYFSVDRINIGGGRLRTGVCGLLGSYRCDIDGENLRVKALILTDTTNRVKGGSRIDFIIPLQQIKSKQHTIEVSFESKDLDRIGTWRKSGTLTLKKYEKTE